MINMDKFWDIVDEVKWTTREDRKFLKIWVDYDDLRDFARLLQTSSNNYPYLDKCTMLSGELYIEMDDEDVEYFLEFKDIDEFIQLTRIEEY